MIYVLKMSELNEFFEQILHTERSLSTRNTKLRALKEEIQTCHAALLQVKEEAERRQGELAVRNLKMVDHEMEARLLVMRKSILEEQRGKFSEANQILAAELEETEREVESQRHLFLEEAKEFAKSYDLTGSGFKHREEQNRKKISILQDELLLLESEVTEFDSEREQVEKLQEKLSEDKKALKQTRQRKEALQNQLTSNKAKRDQLEMEKKDCDSKFSTGPEVIRLQKELEECRHCPEEKLYKSFHRELEELQRICYHKQMKQHMSLQKKRETHKSESSIPNRRETYLTGKQWQHGHYNPYTHEYSSAASSYGLQRETGEEVEAEESMRDVGRDSEQDWDNELEGMETVNLEEVEEGGLDGSGDERLESDEKEMEEEEDEDGQLEDYSERHGAIEAHEEDYRVERPLHEKQTADQAARKTQKSSETSRNSHVYVTRPYTFSTAKMRLNKGSHSAGECSFPTSAKQPPVSYVSLIDSPSPGPKVVRKQSGQSIYKAPGQQDSVQGLPKTAKKVRFRY